MDIFFHNSSRTVMSTDKKICKIWERDDPTQGKILTNIEAPADINAVLPISDRRGPTGLVMLAGEQSRVMTYFIPQLGPAPRWCSFLEGITEELEEEVGQNVYEDFKFVSRQELDDLGATAYSLFMLHSLLSPEVQSIIYVCKCMYVRFNSYRRRWFDWLQHAEILYAWFLHAYETLHETARCK